MGARNESPDSLPGGEPLLLTLPEAAVVTGLSVKALTRRIERGTVPSELHQGRRVVRRGELERLNLIGAGNRIEGGGGEVVMWRELYERERQEREAATKKADSLQQKLVAIANAGPIPSIGSGCVAARASTR